MEKQRIDELHQRYFGNPEVVIAGSMPSIEYWFLLHYEHTTRYFGTSAKVIEALRKYMPNFEKKEQYLRQEKWLAELIEGNRMDDAYRRARKIGRDGASYSDIWKAIDAFKGKEGNR